LKNVDARKEVARILGGEGLKGRKGGPISPQTLFQWTEQIRGEDENGKRRTSLEEYRAVLSGNVGHVPTVEEAKVAALLVTRSVLFKAEI